MKCAVFNSAGTKKLLDSFSKMQLQAGVEVDVFIEIVNDPEIDGGLYQFHQDVGNLVENLKPIKIDSITLDDPSEYDRVYIMGANFGLRSQLFDMGFNYDQVVMCYGDISMCRCPLDEIFIIAKRRPQVSFKKKPAEIYRQYEGETTRAHARRAREGFFDKYCRGEGLDVGYGGDVIKPDASGWDFRNGDAQYLSGIAPESFDYVYSSHCLEHMYDVRVALKNWFRVVRRGGYLLLAIPHRDLYEKKTQLPSRWNADHKHMFLIGRAEPPDTLDIIEEIRESLSNYDIKYVKACDEGHTITDPLEHSDGEYQIELVIQKL